MSAYELHIIIKKNYQDICSSSIGNIQLSLKKMGETNLVTYHEINESKVLKKMFSITIEGREHFMSWMNSSIEINKAKNIEIGKLLFMGFLKKEKQIEMIEATIKDLEEDHKYLSSIRKIIEMENNDNQIFTNYLNANDKYRNELLASTQQADLETCLNNVSTSGSFTLQFGIDVAEFQLNWFKDLKTKIERE